jgi:hypothetical protein
MDVAAFDQFYVSCVLSGRSSRNSGAFPSACLAAIADSACFVYHRPLVPTYLVERQRISVATSTSNTSTRCLIVVCGRVGAYTWRLTDYDMYSIASPRFVLRYLLQRLAVGTRYRNREQNPPI